MLIIKVMNECLYIGKGTSQSFWFTYRVCFIKSCLIITTHGQCSLSYKLDLSFTTDAIFYKKTRRLVILENLMFRTCPTI